MSTRFDGWFGRVDVEGTASRAWLACRQNRAWWLLAGIVLLGASVRLYGLGAESFWLDEGFTYEEINGQWSRSYLDYFGNPPEINPHSILYHVVMKAWTSVFGFSPFAMRSFSAIAGTATIPFVYALTTRLWDRRTGLVAALVFALSPFYVWESRNARMYALLTLFAVILLYSLVVLFDGWSRRAAAGYVLAGVGIAFTHAFGGLAVVAVNVYVLVHVAWTRTWIGDLSAGRWAGLHLAIAVPTVPHFVDLYRGLFVTDEYGSFRNNWDEGVMELDPATALWEMTGSYFGRAYPARWPGDYGETWQFSGVDLSILGEVAFVVAVALLVAGTVPLVRRTIDPERPQPELLLVAWVTVQVAVVFAYLTTYRPLYVDRYIATAMVGTIPLVARGVTVVSSTSFGVESVVPSVRTRTVVVAAVVGLLLGGGVAGLHADPQKEQYAEGMGIIDEHAAENDVVVVSPPNRMMLLEYYSERNHEYEPVNLGTHPGEIVRRIEGNPDGIWILIIEITNIAELPEGVDQEYYELVIGGLEQQGYEIDRDHSDLRGIALYRVVPPE